MMLSTSFRWSAVRSFPSLDFLDDASAAKRVACVSCLVLHAFVYLLRSEDLLVVSKSDAHAFANRVRIFTLKRQD